MDTPGPGLPGARTLVPMTCTSWPDARHFPFPNRPKLLASSLCSDERGACLEPRPPNPPAEPQDAGVGLEPGTLPTLFFSGWGRTGRDQPPFLRAPPCAIISSGGLCGPRPGDLRKHLSRVALGLQLLA